MAADERVVLTLNQVVARNVRRLRKAHDWKQSELVEHLNGNGAGDSPDRWTVSKLSDVERAGDPPGQSVRSRRERRITMNELARFALALSVSVLDLLLPPDDGTLVRIEPHGSVRSFDESTVMDDL